MPADRNAIGIRGESIVVNLLTRPYNNGEPFFRPQFLGDKYPTIDFFVELVGVSVGPTPFFLVQAKTTTLALMPRESNLPIRVGADDMAKLVRYPSPTYIIGIHDPEETGYIWPAIQGGRMHISSLPTRYSLDDPAVLADLYEEVLHFWQSNWVTFHSSRFA